MEDIRKRLELENPSVQIQAAWKLYQTILKTTTPERPLLNLTSPEVIDVKLLLDHCSEGDDVVVKSCCGILVQLVHAGKAEFTSALNGFLNLVPSAR
ncbi:focadhesin-like [Liolophura sinensis]|uniref:focadhesin-like n=1 Tax=Liolophura sinensis TaxID=3198878 RepID=UPI003158915B